MQDQNSKRIQKTSKDFIRFTLKPIDFLDHLPAGIVSRRLGAQLLRSGTSIPGNYIEGQSASNKKDFTSYFTTSLKSVNESKVWLSLLRDSRRTKTEETAWLLSEREEFGNIFA